MNRLKYGAKHSLGNLKQSPQNNLALRHSMMLYSKNALYSFIPKNACSTLRLSVAIENGCVDGFEQGHWIHQNNSTFNANLGEAINVNYSFVLLRCPFRRLASVFLDKFVSKEPDAWQYRQILDRKVELDDLSFQGFVLSLRSPKVLNANIHWRKQSDFLIYQEYSDYFSLENFSEAIATLKQKIGFEVIDARALTNHGTERYQVVADNSYATCPAFDIAIMKRKGECPAHQSLYDEETVDIVKKLYKVDIELYTEKFGRDNLLFI